MKIEVYIDQSPDMLYLDDNILIYDLLNTIIKHLIVSDPGDVFYKSQIMTLCYVINNGDN